MGVALSVLMLQNVAMDMSHLTGPVGLSAQEPKLFHHSIKIVPANPQTHLKNNPNHLSLQYPASSAIALQARAIESVSWNWNLVL